METTTIRNTPHDAYDILDWAEANNIDQLDNYSEAKNIIDYCYDSFVRCKKLIDKCLKEGYVFECDSFHTFFMKRDIYGPVLAEFGLHSKSDPNNNQFTIKIFLNRKGIQIEEYVKPTQGPESVFTWLDTIIDLDGGYFNKLSAQYSNKILEQEARVFDYENRKKLLHNCWRKTQSGDDSYETVDWNLGITVTAKYVIDSNRQGSWKYYAYGSEIEKLLPQIKEKHDTLDEVLDLAVAGNWLLSLEEWLG